MIDRAGCSCKDLTLFAASSKLSSIWRFPSSLSLSVSTSTLTALLSSGSTGSGRAFRLCSRFPVCSVGSSAGTAATSSDSFLFTLGSLRATLGPSCSGTAPTRFLLGSLLDGAVGIACDCGADKGAPMLVAAGVFLGSLVLGGGTAMVSSVFKVIFTRAPSGR